MKRQLGKIVDLDDRFASAIDDVSAHVDYVVQREKVSIGELLKQKVVYTKANQLGKLDTDVKYSVFRNINPPLSINKGRIVCDIKILEEKYNEGKPQSDQMDFSLGDNGLMKFRYRYDNISNGYVKSSEKMLRLKKRNNEAQEHIQHEMSRIIDNLSREASSKAIIASFLGSSQSLSYNIPDPSNPQRSLSVNTNIDQIYNDLISQSRGTVDQKRKASLIQSLMQKAKKIRPNLGIEDSEALLHKIFSTSLDDISKDEEAAYRGVTKKSYGKSLRKARSISPVPQQQSPVVSASHYPGSVATPATMPTMTSSPLASVNPQTLAGITTDVRDTIMLDNFIKNAQDFPRSVVENFLYKKTMAGKISQKDYESYMRIIINNTLFEGENRVIGTAA